MFSVSRVSRSSLHRVGATVQHARAVSMWANVPQGPPDPILGLTQAFLADDRSPKVSLGVGAYRDGSGKPFVLQSVKKAEQAIVASDCDHEYLPITGFAPFVEAATTLAYGEGSTALSYGGLAMTQCLSGTGGLRLCAEYLSRFLPGATMYMPAPTWANHKNCFKDAGCGIADYRYLASDGVSLDFDGLLEDIAGAPSGSAFLLHMCAHNPTGVDPSPAQWAEVSKAIKAGGHLAFFDNAYQGFASGDPDADAISLRQFVDDGHKVILAQSFAKNVGLYGERIGAFSVMCEDAEEKARVDSQLKLLIRPMYSSPPVHGARIVHKILSDPALRSEWATEVEDMAERIKSMRTALVSSLSAAGSRKDWSHVVKQIGMFAYTGLSSAQVDTLREEHAIYMTQDGRISIAGLNESNVEMVAAGMHSVSK